MRTLVLRVAVGATLAGLLLAGLVAAFPARRSTFVGAFELIVGAIATAAIVAAVRALRPAPWETRTPFEARSEGEPLAETPDDLERIDRLLVLGTTNAFDAHHRVRPLLRALAAERLHARHAVELDRQPERARELLGDELWEVVRPDRALGLRSAPGLPLEHASRLVDALEAV